jgi:hypothetical protein
MTATPDMLTPPALPSAEATSHADPTASATDGHRHLAAALRDNARDATRVLPLPGITSP